MCESNLLDKIPEFETELVHLQRTLADLQPSLSDPDSSMALAMAITRFTTQAQALVSYFHRHNASSLLSSDDGAAFLDNFRSLQLKTLEETLKLYRFLAG